MSNYVYKDEKDKKIELLEKDKMTLMTKLQQLNLEYTSIDKIKKQNELYRAKLNSILNKDTGSSEKIGGNKVESLLIENKKLTELLKIKEDEIVKANVMIKKYDALKEERNQMDQNVLDNQKVKYLMSEIEKYKNQIQISEKIKTLVDENEELKKKINHMIQNNDRKNSMQIEKLLNDRKRNISEIIKKQKRIDRLLKFISENNLMSKLIAY